MVTTQAKYVKRRSGHTQQIRPSLAATLKDEFKNRMPTAGSLKMPPKSHLADMLRDDLADARAVWIKAAENDPKEQERRQRSDCLAAVNHAKEVAVFYSTRHGHGTALAAAIGAMPDLSYPLRQVITGTNGAEMTGGEVCIANALPAGCTSLHSGAPKQNLTSNEESAESFENTGESNEIPENGTIGLLAELADAMDSKSITQKVYRFDSDRGHCTG